MVGMIVNRVRHRILRVTLEMAIFVNYQFSDEPHKPIRKIALFRIILVKRPVDAYKNFLRQVFGCLRTRGESVRQIEYPPRKGRNDLLPRGSVTCTSAPNQFSTIDLRHSLSSFQRFSLQQSLNLPVKQQSLKKPAPSMIS